MLRHTLFKITRNVTTIRTLKTSVSLHESNEEISYCRVQLLGRVGEDPMVSGPYSREVVLFPVAINYRVKLDTAATEDVSELDPTGELYKHETIETSWLKVFVTRPVLKTYVMESVFKRSRVLCTGVLVKDMKRNLFTMRLNDIILLDTPAQYLRRKSNMTGTS